MIANYLARAATILACLAGAASFARAAAPTAEGDISGTVVDSVSGTPLSGREVRIMQAGVAIAIATTHALGRHVLHHLAAGTYPLEGRYPGYRAAPQHVTAGAGAPAHAHV